MEHTSAPWKTRVQHILTTYGLTHAALAARLRVRRATVSDWARGVCEPSGPATVLLETMEKESGGAAAENGTATERGT
jgi:DNA-binding transcriptional regulator YiaG